jgi:molybdenum cofactor cytidylyltransferase
MRAGPTVIILALGREKQSLRGASVGDSLLSTLRHAQATRLPVAVVTTLHLAPQVRECVATRDIVVLPASVPHSIGEAISAGVAAHSNAPCWLVLPADMPHLQPATLLAAAEALGQHPVVRAQHRGRGNELLGFGAELYSELFKLKGDTAHRRLIARYPVQEIEVDDPGVVADLYTQA